MRRYSSVTFKKKIFIDDYKNNIMLICYGKFVCERSEVLSVDSAAPFETASGVPEGTFSTIAF